MSRSALVPRLSCFTGMRGASGGDRWRGACFLDGLQANTKRPTRYQHHHRWPICSSLRGLQSASLRRGATAAKHGLLPTSSLSALSSCSSSFFLASQQPIFGRSFAAAAPKQQNKKPLPKKPFEVDEKEKAFKRLTKMNDQLLEGLKLDAEELASLVEWRCKTMPAEDSNQDGLLQYAWDLTEVALGLEMIDKAVLGLLMGAFARHDQVVFAEEALLKIDQYYPPFHPRCPLPEQAATTERQQTPSSSSVSKDALAFVMDSEENKVLSVNSEEQIYVRQRDYDALLHCFAKHGHIDKAVDVLHRLFVAGLDDRYRVWVNERKKLMNDNFPVRQVHEGHAVALIVSLGKLARLDDAFAFVQAMPSKWGITPSIKTYNSLITACIDSFQPDRAFDVALMENVTALGNLQTNVLLIKACAALRDIPKAEQLVREANDKFFTNDSSSSSSSKQQPAVNELYDALLLVYAHAGQIQRAIDLLQFPPNSNGENKQAISGHRRVSLDTRAALLSACIEHDAEKQAWEMLKELHQQKPKRGGSFPLSATVLSKYWMGMLRGYLLKREKKAEHVIQLLQKMWRQWGFAPTEEMFALVEVVLKQKENDHEEKPNEEEEEAERARRKREYAWMKPLKALRAEVESEKKKKEKIKQELETAIP